MNQDNKNRENQISETDEERRAFLRKGIYAAYATPVILSLLVEDAKAAKPSWGREKDAPPPLPPQK